MRKGFEQELRAYNTSIKSYDDVEKLQEGRLSDSMEALLKKTAIAEDTPRQTQREIFSVQIEKQEIMRELQDEITGLDDPEYTSKRKTGTRLLVEDGDGFFVKRKGELHERVSLGDLMTDADYGINYYLDESMPRNIRKRYLIESAKSRLRARANKQIIANESSSRYTDKTKAEAFEKIGKEKKDETEVHFGLIAEKMVRNFLTKLTWDFPELSFDIEPVDIDRDMREKIDFIVHVRSRHRGVKVDVPEDHNTGIQFTINTTPENLEHKHEQIEHAERAPNIDEVVLVSLPASEFTSAYNEWNAYKTSGGPDRYWDVSTKEIIFRNVLAGVLPKEEIESSWQKIANAESEQQAVAA
ncbi:MAG: hypothetical protein WC495_02900 [Patescibacteria group bacterium]|jgi:hypothetical protein